MAVRNAKTSSIQSFKSSVDQDLSYNPPSNQSWIRNPSWLSLPSMTSSDSKIVGLIAIFPDIPGGADSNFVAFSAAANYTVDWGDGVVENFNSGVKAEHIYSFNNSNLNNTNAPVTLVDSGDLVQRTNHGYTNGMTIEFYNILSTTGIKEGQIYYVINANTNDFQISSTKDGSPISLTTNGSANLLIYKQAIITITPQAGQNLTTIQFNQKHSSISMFQPVTNWLDIKISSPNFTTITFYSSPSPATNTLFYRLENIEILNFGSKTDCTNLFLDLSIKNAVLSNASVITNFSLIFSGCSDLLSVSIDDTSNVTSMSSMFNNCKDISSIPYLNCNKVTNMQSMFANCYSLINLQPIDCTSATNITYMFSGCSSLVNSPILLNTGKATSALQMFADCNSLRYISNFDTSSMTNMQEMFLNCYSLNKLPLLNTASVTNMQSMFSGCRKLQTIPNFNTSNVTNMSSMFNDCKSLTKVPLLNTSKVTNMDSMFYGCYELETVPQFDTTKVSNMGSMFMTCYSLKNIPIFYTPSLTSLYRTFSDCHSLESIPLIQTSGVTSLNQTFQNCTSLKSIPLFDTSKVTDMSSTFYGCGIKTIPKLNTSKVTTMNSAFYGSKIQYINELNISGCTSLRSAFQFCSFLTYVFLKDPFTTLTLQSAFVNCNNLKSVIANGPLYINNFEGGFQNCYAVENLPDIDIGSVSFLSSSFSSNFLLRKSPNITSVKTIFPVFSSCATLTYFPPVNLYPVGLGIDFSNCKSLSWIEASGHRLSHSLLNCNLSSNALKTYMNNLGDIASAGRILTITGNYGVGSGYTATVGCTAQSKVVTCANTSNLSSGMMVTGSGAGISTGLIVTSDISANTLAFSGHGLDNNTRISFSSSGNTGGILLNNIYYVTNTSADSFQISSASGGSVVDLTGSNSSMTIKYPSYIQSVNTNVSITLDTPVSSGIASTTWSFRTLDTQGALLKGWTITF